MIVTLYGRSSDSITIQLQKDLDEVKDLKEPFLALRDKGWLTVESFDDLEVVQLSNDGGRTYIRVR